MTLAANSPKLLPQINRSCTGGIRKRSGPAAYCGSGAVPTGVSRRDAVAEVYDAVAKAALVQQLEMGMDAGGQGTLATTN